MWLVLVNARAGYVRRIGLERLQAQLMAVLGEDGHVVPTDTLAALDAALAQYAPETISALVPVGGDGTVSTVLTRAAALWGFNRLPPILTVFAGTMNMVAHAANGSSETPVRTVQRLLRAQSSGSWRLKPQSVIRTSTGHVGFAAGFGIPTRFLAYYYDLGGGNAGALQSIADHAWSVLRRSDLSQRLFASMPVQQTGLPSPAAYSVSIVLALTLGTLPLGFRLEKPGDDGHMLVLHGQPTPWRLIASLPLIHRGFIPDSIGVRKDHAQNLFFCFREPTAWQLDGDVHAPVSELTWDASGSIRLVTE